MEDDKFLDRLFPETSEKTYRFPDQDQTLNRLDQRLLSSFSTDILLGWNENEGEVTISQEEMQSNWHLLGMPGEGKSMLMQLLMREVQERLITAQKNKENAPGMCLIDGSDNGDTARKMLRWCAYKGYKKVVVIDPKDMFDYFLVPCINPFEHLPLFLASNMLMDTIQASWGADWKGNANIRLYTPALIECLYRTNYTLAESKWFLSDHPDYIPNRTQILETRKKVTIDGREVEVPAFGRMELNRKHLEQAFRTGQNFTGYKSTVNRFNPFTHDKLELIYGSQKGLNFYDLIRDGYIILVSLDSGKWGKEAQTLLGTMIINLLIYHKEQMLEGKDGKKGYTLPYYLFIDEVGQFASPKLSDILDLKRKLNLWVCAAHQRFDQIKDKDLTSALYSANIHAVFNCENVDDRLKMVRSMYGGELKDRDVAFAMKDTPKQEAYLKIRKRKPSKVNIAQLEEPPITDEEFAKYKTEVIYNLNINPHYQPLMALRKEINNRFVPQRYTASGTVVAGGTRTIRRKENQVYAKPTPRSDNEGFDPGTKDDSNSVSRTVSLQQEWSAEEAYNAATRTAQSKEAGELPGHDPVTKKDGEGRPD